MQNARLSPEKTETYEPAIVAVNAGHMYYDKCIVLDDTNPIFIKAYNDTLFSNRLAADHTREHLQHEAAVYDALKKHGFHALPDQTFYDNHYDILYMSAHLPQSGWHWKMPEGALADTYIETVMDSLQTLETIPPQILPDRKRQTSLDELYEFGWGALQTPDSRQTALTKIQVYEDKFHTHVQPGIPVLMNLLANNTEMINAVVKNYLSRPKTAVGHFDARQSNMAWHPEKGLAIVDWSWASPAIPKSDTTMFLIDVFKSGADIRSHLSSGFDPEFALLQTGYWVARAILPAQQPQSTVRFHQLASAVTAATLLTNV